MLVMCNPLLMSSMKKKANILVFNSKTATIMY